MTSSSAPAPNASPLVEPERAGTGDTSPSVPADLDDITTEDIDIGLNHVTFRMALIRNLDDKHARITAMFDQEISRMEAVKAERLGVVERDRARLAGDIESWHRAMHERGLVDKTVTTPHGSSRLTVPRKAKLFAPDGLEPLAAWAAEAHPEIVRTSVNMTDIRKVVDVIDGKPIDPTTGEIVPGLVAEVPRSTVKVTTDEGEAL